MLRTTGEVAYDRASACTACLVPLRSPEPQVLVEKLSEDVQALGGH